MVNYEFIDNTDSVSIIFKDQDLTVPKNEAEFLITNLTDDKILEIRSNSVPTSSLKIDLNTDTITGIGIGSTTATELKTALIAIFFLDDTGGGGGGSGTATLPSWSSYADSEYTDINKFTISSGVTTKLPNNGVNSITSYMPSGVDFYDAVTGKITPFALGETYELRVNFKADSTTNNSYAVLTLNIGGTQGDIIERTLTFPRGSGVDHSFSTTTSIFVLGTFLANGGDINITPSVNIDVWDISFTIVRNSTTNINVADAPSDGKTYGRKDAVWTEIVSGGASCGSVQNFNLLNIDSGTVGDSSTTLLSIMRSSSDFTVNELGCFVDFDNTATFRLGVYTEAGVLLGETDTITAGALGTGFKSFSVLTPFDMSCNVNYFAAVKFINNGSGNGFLLGSQPVLNDSALANISNFSSGDSLPNPVGTINSTDVAYYISASS